MARSKVPVPARVFVVCDHEGAVGVYNKRQEATDMIAEENGWREADGIDRLDLRVVEFVPKAKK